MAYFYRLVISVLVGLAGSAYANQPPRYCEVKAGNTYAGTCNAEFTSKPALVQSLFDPWLAAKNSANPGYPRQKEGEPQIGAYNGANNIYFLQKAFWMNGTYKIYDDFNGYMFPACHMFGSPPHPSPTGTVEAQACPGTFTCAAPLVVNSTKDKCVSPLEKDCSDRKGAPSGMLEVTGGLVSAGAASTPSMFCDNTAASTADSANGFGCTVSSAVLDIGFQFGTPPKHMYRMHGTFDGSACQESSAPAGATPSVPSTSSVTVTPPTDKPKCPGGISRVVNGLEVCTSFKDYLGESTSTGIDGTVLTNVDGTKTEKQNSTETKCVANVCTSTTTTITIEKSASGAITSTTTAALVVSSADKGTFCSKNPTSSQCGAAGGGGAGGKGDGEGSAFGGACGAGFTCSGDAALCAIAKASNETKCLLDATTATQEASAYTTAKAASGSGLGTSTVALSAASFTSTDMFGSAASCIVDVNIVVSGQSIAMPFSTVCPHLEKIGIIFLGIAWIMAFVIVGKGVTA